MGTSEPGVDHGASGHSCAHCDSAEDHHALDEKGIVDSFRRQLTASGLTRSALALAAVLIAAWLAPPSALSGIAAWAIATVAGMGVMVAANRRVGMANSVILATVASAALTPLAAWAIAQWVGASPAAALAAGGGWFAAVGVVELLRDRKLGGLLVADSRDGEAARQGVLFGNPASPWAGLAWSASTGALFGVWVWVIGAVPLAVIPLVPLQVALALLSRRRAR